MRALILLLCIVASMARAEVVVLPGSSPQSAPLGQVLPNPVRIQVMENGAPVPGASVYFRLPEYPLVTSAECYGGDLETVCSKVTDANGIATFSSLASNVEKAYSTVVLASTIVGDDVARKPLGSATLSLRFGSPTPPLQLSVLSGSNQRVIMGTSAAEPVRIRVLDRDGQPIANQQIYLDSTQDVDSLGFLGYGPVQTDSSGVAITPAIAAGWTPGIQTLRMSTFDTQAQASVYQTADVQVVDANGAFDVALTNMWWAGPLENGWGMSIVKHGPQLFNVIFAYDNLGSPTWYVQPGGRWRNAVGSTFTGPIYSPQSAPWFAYQSTRFVPGIAVGEADIQFKGAERAKLTTSIGPNAFLTKDIVRQDFTGDVASPIQGVADMWWGGPVQNGWGIAVLEQFGNLFLVWFTYDAQGKPTWFAMPGGSWSNESTYAGTVYQTAGPKWLEGEYVASDLRVRAAGAYALRFQGADRAMFTYNLDGRSGTLNLMRQPFE